MNNNVSSHLIIFITLLLSMCLSVAPISNTLLLVAPQWTLLTLLFWSINTPHKVGVGTGWITGIIFDVLTNAAVGHHALIFSLVTYFGVIVYNNIKHYPIWQQTTLILIFLFIIQLINLLLTKLTMGTDHNILFLLPVLTTTLFWPILHSALKHTQQSFDGR